MTPVKDPVCGMTVDPARAAGKFDYKGATYYFCAKSCEQRFAADPEKYLSAQSVMLGSAKSAAPSLVTIGMAGPSMAASSAREIDPVCGMSVDPTHAAGKYDYNGKTYYFCNPRCEEKFKASPETCRSGK